MSENDGILKKGTFRPRARIMRTLGSELISSETVALIELVKNAYDADATRVTISFSDPLNKGKGGILVADNGHGMTTDTVLNAWMEPATDYRKHKRQSEFLNRRVVGEKGIGRFAASKLASSFTMVTRRIHTDVETRVYLDWGDFDDETKYLDQVTLNWEARSPEDIKPGGVLEKLLSFDDVVTEIVDYGTYLNMASLSTDWDGLKLEALRTGLARLISPFRSNQRLNASDEFDIYLKLPERFQQFAGKVSTPETMQFPHYLLKGAVDQEGAYKLTIEISGEEPIPVENKMPFGSDRKSTCGPFVIELRVWDRDRDALAELGEKFSRSISAVRQDLDELAGINIYRDGFRVLPYGEPQNDWLRLDMRRVQNPTRNLSNNQIVGFISITSEDNPELRDQSNREGIVESQAFDDFQKIIVTIRTELEGRRYLRRHPKVEKKTPGIFANLNVNDIVSYVRKNYPEDRNLQTVIEKNKEKISGSVVEVQKVLSRYWRLATLGQLIDIVLHDGRTPLAKVKNEIILALMVFKSSTSYDESTIRSIESSLKLIQNQADVLSTVFNRIEPFSGRKRGEPGIFILEDEVKKGFNVLSSEISQIGARISLPETKTDFYMEPSEIQEIIVNLLNNSLYWLTKVPKEKREISVSISNLAENLVMLIFSDSGPGIPSEFRDEIFEPYFSLKPNGVGLGLTIVGTIITEYYYGELVLLDNGPLPGATFQIIMGWRK